MPQSRIDSLPFDQYVPPAVGLERDGRKFEMKVVNSLKSAKKRHRDCRVVRRRGRVFVICKSNRRFKARQG